MKFMNYYLSGLRRPHPSQPLDYCLQASAPYLNDLRPNRLISMWLSGCSRLIIPLLMHIDGFPSLAFAFQC